MEELKASHGDVEIYFRGDTDDQYCHAPYVVSYFEFYDETTQTYGPRYSKDRKYEVNLPKRIEIG